MYKNKFILVVKHNSKVLRETKNIVQLPFNSEYSLLLKNENDRRAIVNIKIDSKDILNGSGIILNANSELNLERFLENNDKGRKFKFVELSHGGISDKQNPENGLIEVEYWLEQQIPITTWATFTQPIQNDLWWPPINPYPYKKFYDNEKFQNPIITCGITNNSQNLNLYATNFCSAQNNANDNMQLSTNIGGTVKGSKSNQKFENCYFREKDLTSYTQIRLWLRATKDPQYVEDTKTKFCTECGKKLQFKDKFCSSCGAQLEFLAKNSLTIK